jgi:hypothetical protein
MNMHSSTLTVLTQHTCSAAAHLEGSPEHILTFQPNQLESFLSCSSTVMLASRTTTLFFKTHLEGALEAVFPDGCLHACADSGVWWPVVWVCLAADDLHLDLALVEVNGALWGLLCYVI